MTRITVSHVMKNFLRRPRRYRSRGGYFAADGHWAVENEGVAPDVDVEIWPIDFARGHDTQLERAVEVALKQLAEKPVVRRMQEPPPPTWGKRR